MVDNQIMLHLSTIILIDQHQHGWAVVNSLANNTKDPDLNHESQRGMKIQITDDR